MQKVAIFDEIEQKALLGACEGDREYIPIWLMMRCGMHVSDVSKKNFRIESQFIMWHRVKNREQRREMIPQDLLLRLKNWLKNGRKMTRFGYFKMVSRIGERIGHPEYSPNTLRHTFCIQELRVLTQISNPPPDPISLLSRKMGCSREVVMQNYLDLTQWERLGSQS